ncbi:DUF4224 domain-containing protein [Undibacterium sp. SXout7W]|uniref:DUF4224 domain-containing protein n=1 Tax=Undibacterium sp. SXout7W TaxID=3413049 RepID=UPI003BF381E6
MSNYLSASELAELVDCKPNQRKLMCDWLEKQNWNYVLSHNGLPKVARAYHDKRMGITEGRSQEKYSCAPNLGAFA